MLSVTMSSVEVYRYTEDGELIFRKAYIRDDPEKDAYGRLKVNADGSLEFKGKGTLRTRMLADYAKKGVIAYIPRALVADVRDAFLKYAETFPFWREPAFTAVMNDVTGTFYDLETQEGRRQELLLNLAAYRCLRNLERTKVKQPSAS
ncbi:hypothetical protein IJI72_01085 [Candidatus Saccharibacteria bacterium]|nr:hypothetical protein [Candidatus Saccharibacteria bacterium]